MLQSLKDIIMKKFCSKLENTNEQPPQKWRPNQEEI